MAEPFCRMYQKTPVTTVKRISSVRISPRSAAFRASCAIDQTNEMLASDQKMPLAAVFMAPPIVESCPWNADCTSDIMVCMPAAEAGDAAQSSRAAARPAAT